MRKHFLSSQALLSFMVFSTNHLYATITTVEVMSDGTHARYLLRDYHRDYVDGRNTIEQHNDILWALRQKKPDVFLLAEDSHSYDGPNEKIKHSFQKQYGYKQPRTIEGHVGYLHQELGIDDPERVKGSTDMFEGGFLVPMACLPNQSRALGINCYNVECGQMLERYEDNNTSFTKAEVIKDLSDYTDEIGRNEKLLSYCQYLKRELKELEAVALTDDTQGFLQKASRVRAFLVDARILGKVTDWNTVTHGFICAGGLHMEAVRHNLESQLGYKCVDIIGLHENGSYLDFFKKFENSPKIAEKICVIQNPLNLKKTFSDIFAKTTNKG